MSESRTPTQKENELLHRALIASLSDFTSPAHERAAIVKFLRTQKLWTELLGFTSPQMLADAIERGEHTKG